MDDYLRPIECLRKNGLKDDQQLTQLMLRQGNIDQQQAYLLNMENSKKEDKGPNNEQKDDKQ